MMRVACAHDNEKKYDPTNVLSLHYVRMCGQIWNPQLEKERKNNDSTIVVLLSKGNLFLHLDL